MSVVVHLVLEAGPAVAPAPELQVGRHALPVVSLDVLQIHLPLALRAADRQSNLALQHVILDVSSVGGLEVESQVVLTSVNTASMFYVGHRQIVDIVPPHTHRQTYIQTDILNIPEF